MSSETASFTDPQFLAQYGLNRVNALEYFLHQLNPFRTKAVTCNEELHMQGISIGLLMYNGFGAQQSVPLTLERAEEEYNSALSRLLGEQYELLQPPPTPPQGPGQPIMMDPSQSPLFTIRHILRAKNKVTTLGIYYILEGIIYKSPSARALMKYNVARTCQGLIDACDTLSVCANYTPTTGYYWDFEAGSKLSQRKRQRQLEEEDETDIFKQLRKVKKKSMIIDKKRRPGERTEEEEEGTRAKDKVNSILLRLNKSSLVTGSRQKAQIS